MQDLTSKITGSTYTAAEFVEFQTELGKLITNESIVQSGGDLNQIAKALSTFVPGGDFLTATGTEAVTVLSAVGSRQPVASLIGGMRFRFRPVGTNTGAVTVNVDTLGAKSVFHEDGGALIAGDLNGSLDATIRWDTASGGRFLLVSAPVAFNRGYISGFHYKNDTTDADHDISLAEGACAAEGNMFNLALTATTIKSIDVDWVAGAGGGMPAILTPPVANQWYGIFVISGSSATTDWGFDTASNASNLLADATSVTGDTYDQFRQVGWVKTDGTTPGNLLKFFIQPEEPNYTKWGERLEDFEDTTITEGLETFEASAPPGSLYQCTFDFKWVGGEVDRDFLFWVSSPDEEDVTPTSGGAHIQLHSNDLDEGGESHSMAPTPVDSSSNCRWRGAWSGASSTNVELEITAHGYWYSRGQHT